jgi:cyclic pyranopterin phosphate synthase
MSRPVSEAPTRLESAQAKDCSQQRRLLDLGHRSSEALRQSGLRPLRDQSGRAVYYLRLSITDRCNERCLYCRPEGYHGWAQRPDHLTAAELVRLVRVATELGFRKFRLTGGEPLVRPDLVEIVRRIASLPGVEMLGLSTNGLRLAALARPLRQAGLHTVNVSLDALEPELYRRITGGDLTSVLAGIRAAIEAGFQQVKLNTVLLRGLNENQLWPLVQFAADHNLPLRFIELMPIRHPLGFTETSFLPATEVMERLSQQDRLVPEPDRPLGSGPAKYYRLERTGAVVGFVSVMTDRDFCQACNRIRITADGKIRPCLGRPEELDVRAALRQSASDEVLAALLRDAVSNKPESHLFRHGSIRCRPMVALGG